LKDENKASNKVIAHIRYEVHLINNLKTKFLISMNILGLKQVIINILNQRLRFESCERISIFCEIKAQNNVRIRQIIRTTKKKIILARSIAKIAITLKRKSELSKRDFLFELTMLEAYAYFVNANFQFINFRNDKEIPQKLDNRRRVKRIIEYENKECYVVKKKNHFLATISFFEDHSILSKLDLAKIRFFQKIISKEMKT